MTEVKERFQVELVWNREFHFVKFGPLHDTREAAKRLACEMEDSGDGARVKKTRIVTVQEEVQA